MTDSTNNAPQATRFHFGDSRAVCDELTALVLAGRETATCMPLRDSRAGRRRCR